MIAVVDYEAGNLKSVETALKKLGADFYISSDPARLAEGDKMLFPGVGEAAQAMNRLKRTGLDRTIREFAASGRPLLGICMGAQILFDHSEESDTPCLGILKGKVLRFTSDMGLKIPHMGWITLSHSDHPLYKGIPQDRSFYFVHSYYISPGNSADIIGTSEYGISFTSSVARDNVMATQFHPEKSGEWGLKLLKNFIEL
jgi:glutamine amidotransferase